MTRKDFEMIAAALADAKREGERGLTSLGCLKMAADYIADGCKSANPAFDRKRFLKACGFSEPEPEVIEGLGQFRAGRGAVATEWCSTKEEALEQFHRLNNA
jgi:hypothetical protein